MSLQGYMQHIPAMGYRSLTPVNYPPVYLGDFGGSPAASATVNTNAFVDALTYLQSLGGGILFVEPGEHTVLDNKISITSGITIAGFGKGISIIKLAAGTATNQAILIGSTIVGDYQYGCGLSDITIDGNRGATLDNPSTKLIQIAYVDGMEMSRVEVKESRHFGVGSKYCYRGNFSDLYVHDTNRDGLTFGEGNYGCVVTNYISRRTGDDGMSVQGHNGTASQFMTFSNLFMDEPGYNVTTGGNGFRVAGGQNININGLTVRNPGNKGVLVEPHPDGTPCFNVAINGVVLSGSGVLNDGNGPGVQISSSCANVRISGEIYSSNGHGIVVGDGCSKISINCRVSSSAGHGIFINGTASINEVDIRGSAYLNGKSGILASYVNSLSITGFTAQNNNQLLDATVTANRCGISIIAGSNVIITGVEASDNQGTGTQFYGIRFHTTATAGVCIMNVLCTGNTGSQFTFAVAPTGARNVTGVYGFILNGMNVLEFHDGRYVLQGNGSPESVVVAPISSVFYRTDGGTSTTIYIKESGSGLSTGWIAK